MIRSLVAGLGMLSVLAALIIVAFLMMNSLGSSLPGGFASDASSGGTADSVVLRISGTPGVGFTGTYTWPNGSQTFKSIVGSTPTGYELRG